MTAFCSLVEQPQTRQKGYIHGIFQQRSRCFADTCYRSWSRAWHLGRDQSHGGLRQRQPRREITGHETACG